MTLFKRVFHQNADGETAKPIFPEAPSQLARSAEVELSLDDELPFGDSDGFDPDADYSDAMEDDLDDLDDLDDGDVPDVSSEPLRLEDPIEVPEARFEDRFEQDAPLIEEAAVEPADASPADASPDIESLLMRRVIEKAPRMETFADDATDDDADPTPEASPEASPEAPALASPIPVLSVAPPVAEDAPEAPVAETPIVFPTKPRPGRSARRVRTRMLGFDPGLGDGHDPFEADAPSSGSPAQTYPVGWMVVVEGPGAGNAFAIYNGVSTIGRGEDQTITLDFGDTSISREKHAAIAYDNEQNSFFLGHGGKSNIVRLNERPVLSTEDLSHGDTVRIGETTLRFVALCGAGFAWGRKKQ